MRKNKFLVSWKNQSNPSTIKEISNFLNNNSSGSGIYGFKLIKTGRIYVGSSFDILRRFKDHIRLNSLKTKSNKPLRAGFQKYGLEQFEFGIFEFYDRKGDINDKIAQEKLEQNYQDYLFESPSKLRYNISSKASVPIAQFQSDKSKNAIKNNSGENSILFGLYKGDHPGSKKLVVYDKKGNFYKKFNSVLEASEYLDQHRSTITRLLKYGTISRDGYYFKYQDNYSESYPLKIDLSPLNIPKALPIKPSTGKVSKQRQKIAVYNSEGKLIKMYPSITELRMDLNISPTRISRYKDTGEVYNGYVFNTVIGDESDIPQHIEKPLVIPRSHAKSMYPVRVYSLDKSILYNTINTSLEVKEVQGIVPSTLRSCFTKAGIGNGFTQKKKWFIIKQTDDTFY